jgi:transcriptional regulator with XRE-family HTH domain
MPRDEFYELRSVLREALEATRKSYRQIEDKLGLGHSTLKKLIDGELEIKASHLTRLANLLQIHPREFFELGFPDWPAQHRLADWLTPDRRRAFRQNGLPTTIEELSALIRSIVQEEMAAETPKKPPQA